jgi:SLT domain-containing protein
MQIIPPMYKKFHQKGTSWNMYDPISNIAAAINYIKGVYGSPQNTPANYYDVGGILKPGATLAVNHTGRNEYVLRNDQVQSLAAQGAALAARQIAAMAAAGRGGPGLVVNARELNLDTVDYQRLSAKIDRQRVLDGLLVP